MKDLIPKISIILAILISVLIWPIVTQAQEFTEQTGISLTGVNNSSAAWGDYDNDGDLDILLTGQETSSGKVLKIYNNNNDNTFSEQSGIDISAIESGSVDWGDYDNDGYLDILLTGSIELTNHISRIYRNTGNKSFTEQSEISLTGVSASDGAWGDYDNDGDLDILLSGVTNEDERISIIYKNNGDNTFSEQTGISLEGVGGSSVTWGDYDNDGDLDILLTGSVSIEPYYMAKIYTNNGNDKFTELSGIFMVGIAGGSQSTDWGDYDNDGDLDILITGASYIGETSFHSTVYRNNGNNSFSEQSGISLTGIAGGSAAWGDYDNDGDLDILLSGGIRNGSWDQVSKIYKNNGNNTFTEQTGISLPGVRYCSTAWGDYDNDGDLDILLTGFNGTDTISKIYKNNSPILNTIPSAPTGLNTFFDSDSVVLSWNKATDTETPQDGLTYNAYIYKENGDTVWSSMSDIKTGYRRIPAIGNAQQDTCWKINLSESGTYFWSVQAIDHSFTGSEFALEESFQFSFGPPAPVAENQTSCFGDPVPDLTAEGDSIRWYSDADLEVLVHEGDTFATGQTEPGIYLYYVTQTVDSVNSQPKEVQLTITKISSSITDSSNISCFGMANGTAVVSPAGGTEPYAYQWDDDLNTTNDTVYGLDANLYYYVTITDANICTATDSVMLAEPDLLTAIITDSTLITEEGLSDGTAIATPGGGTSPYTFLWDDNLATTTATVTGLSELTWYHVIVTDANLCAATDSVRLPVEGKLYTLISDFTDVTCYGYSDGTATVSVSEGTPPLEYLWNDEANTTTPQITGLAAGRWYHVTISDAELKTAVDSIYLNVPDIFVVDLGEDRDTCKGESVVLYAGSEYQSYNWSVPDSVSDQITVGEPGIYSITVTDEKGCIAKDSVEVIIHELPAVNLGKDTSICENTLALLNAGPGYTNYEWSVQDSSDQTIYVEDGTYWVSVSDEHGCIGFDTVEVNLHPIATVSIGNDTTICPGDTIILDPGPEYNDYNWSTGSTSQTIEAYNNGDYSIEVTDMNDCLATDTLQLSLISFPGISITTDNNVIYDGDSTLIQVTESGDYSWYPSYLVSDSTGAETWAKPGINTIFYAIGINEYGCRDTAQKQIYVFCHTCPDNKQLITEEGQFNHGCSDKVYLNNSTCSWRIFPDVSPGKIIYLSFDQFDIKPGDTLWIYNGQDATAPLIGKYNNNIIPPDTLFGGINIFVELITNNTNVGEGFTIHYWLDYMQGVPEIQTVNALKIYPNPFSNSTIIEFPEPTTGHYTLILTDILGKKRRIINHITGSKYELKRGNLEKGLYLIEMRCVKVFRGRVLIQ